MESIARQIPSTKPDGDVRPASRRWGLWPAALYVPSLMAFAALTVYGWDYYLTPLLERPHHELYWQLKPGGSLGRTYGMIGMGLMTLMLSYSLRKRWKLLSKLGTLRHWLDFHIWCGVVGPLLIVLHSSFKVTGIVALSFWSMVIVATSGILGRYLYLQFPRRQSGDQLSLSEVESYRDRLREELSSERAVPVGVVERIDKLAKDSASGGRSLLSTLLSLPFGSIRLRRQVRALVAEVPAEHRRHLSRLLEESAMLQRRIRLWSKLQELFHYWHVLHKPFAILMYLFATIHIAVATLTGYGFG